MTLTLSKSIEQTCYWLSKRKNPIVCQPLTGTANSTQVAVVGAGFTGLWTAYFLKQLDRNLDVAVFEQETVGYGASGRNAGIVGNCVDFTPELSIAHFGMREARQLAAIGRRNIDELAAFATDCDFERTGQLHVALSESHVEACRESVHVAAELGLGDYKFLTQEEVQAEIHCPLYTGAVFLPDEGIIDPIKLVDKLKQECLDLGVRFFEKTKVTGIEGNKVETASGTLTFDKLILATDAYSHFLFPKLLRYYIPVYEYILVSEPLSSQQLEIIGWHNRQGVTDGRTFFNYYRLTADNRILWGGTTEAVYFPPNRVEKDCDYSKVHCDELHESFVRHFPQLADLKFPFAWGGPIASTSRLTPFFGSMKKGKIIYGLGYSGHGIGSTRLGGKVLAHMALAKPNDLLNLQMVKYKPFPCPPEPLRRLSVRAVTKSLQNMDQSGRPNLLLKAMSLFGMDFTH